MSARPSRQYFSRTSSVNLTPLFFSSVSLPPYFLKTSETSPHAFLHREVVFLRLVQLVVLQELGRLGVVELWGPRARRRTTSASSSRSPRPATRPCERAPFLPRRYSFFFFLRRLGRLAGGHRDEQSLTLRIDVAGEFLRQQSRFLRASAWFSSTRSPWRGRSGRSPGPDRLPTASALRTKSTRSWSRSRAPLSLSLSASCFVDLDRLARRLGPLLRRRIRTGPAPRS